MKRIALAATAALLFAAATRASDPVGIYAVIDKVVLEPKEGTPERIQVWGVFVVASNRGANHTGPTRGYMYFTTTPGKEDVCRREWADLKRIAGTDTVVAFGSSYRPAPSVVRKPTPKAEPAAPLDADKLRALIADLNNDDFAKRDKATHELEKQGAHAQEQLRQALNGKVSPEARRRIEKLLAATTEKPDQYPLGFGLTKLEGRHGDQWRDLLRSLPEPVSPAEGAAVETGKIMLRAKNIGSAEHKKAGYVFEIVAASGGREESPVVEAGAKETEWSPRMEVEAGKKYTWRVRPVDGQWKGPVAETSFAGKAAR
jgi:hypothetical protein